MSILGQQVSSQAARQMCTRLIKTYGSPVEMSGDTYYAFPRPEILASAGVEGLRALKLSARKAQYITDVAAGVSSGELELESLRSRPDEEVIHILTGIRGIGMWTAQWLLVSALGYPDAFPQGDLALERAVGALANTGGPLRSGEVAEYSRRWSPFRSYVTVYLFAAIRSGRFPHLRQVVAQVKS